jgi:hypothetical protein
VKTRENQELKMTMEAVLIMLVDRKYIISGSRNLLSRNDGGAQKVYMAAHE